MKNGGNESQNGCRTLSQEHNNRAIESRQHSNTESPEQKAVEISSSDIIATSERVADKPLDFLFSTIHTKDKRPLDWSEFKGLTPVTFLLSQTQPRGTNNIQCFGAMLCDDEDDDDLYPKLPPPKWTVDLRRKRDMQYHALAGMESAIAQQGLPPTAEEEVRLSEMRLELDRLAASSSRAGTSSDSQSNSPLASGTPSTDLSSTQSESQSDTATSMQASTVPASHVGKKTKWKFWQIFRKDKGGKA